MQPWIGKAESSSSAGNTTLHYDKTLSHLHHYSAQQQSSSSISKASGFRTSSDDMTNTTTKASAQYHLDNDTQPPFQASYNFSRIPPPNSSISTFLSDDGADVMNFLNTTNYSDQVYDDDLRPESISYISYRHQVDTQHALAEQQVTELMAAEDIVAYLQTTNYTEDIYGIPVLGQWIKEAQQEVKQDKTSEHSQKAIARLDMIRNHLVEKADGDFELAARNAFKMTEYDWSTTFLDSSM